MGKIVGANTSEAIIKKYMSLGETTDSESPKSETESPKSETESPESETESSDKQGKTKVMIFLLHGVDGQEKWLERKLSQAFKVM